MGAVVLMLGGLLIAGPVGAIVALLLVIAGSLTSKQYAAPLQPCGVLTRSIAMILTGRADKCLPGSATHQLWLESGLSAALQRGGYAAAVTSFTPYRRSAFL
jgi:hypothetical protein